MERKMMTEKLNGHHVMMPMAADDMKKVYMERVYAMSHAELFHELMRVHTESARLMLMAQEELEKVRSQLEQYEPIH
jgi:hypothetical protein